ncbi:U4/U6 small nuclear ribonucleoprotein Prp4-like [Watersipora subatra]|uniref:U4/U6 small nuclear ribonucleoprotein Prp4-like n=1 Tax=Watersipora subatra TaxID=2589382 RepID=UPI00355C6663
MSDSDDDITLVPKRQKLVHHGTLEEHMKRHGRNTDSLIQTGIDAGNINVSDGNTMEITGGEPSDSTKAMLAEFERRKRARHIAVPTDDAEVKVKLRSMKEPICFFGEGPADRRERLRDLLSRQGEIQARQEEQQKKQESIKKEQENITWYHEGTLALKEARIVIAKYSLPRAHTRLKQERDNVLITLTQKQAKLQELTKTMQSFTNEASQIGDSRPISYCEFSPNSECLVTASWSGLCKLWSIPSCELVRTLKGHQCQASCITFHPQSGVTQSSQSINLASCDQTGSVKLWNLEADEPIADIEGHSPHRVSRLSFHPSGRFLGTACFDKSWRLWDLEAQEEIVHQEGHSKEVYSLSFQADGALACSGGLDGFGRVWDLRTGRCIMFMEGHLKSVLSVDFSPSGYHVASGSEDNTAKVWDIRQRKCLYTIPAHTNLVSRVKFQPTQGDYLMTASYDNTCKIWSHPTGAPVRTLAAHEGKIMSADISFNLKYIATASFDRTFKLWAPENML